MFLRSPILLAIDVQPHEIRWLCLAHKRQQYIIEKFGITPCAPPLPNPVNTIYWQVLQQILGNIVDREKLHHLPTAMAVSHSNVISRRISLALRLSSDEIETAITHHICQDMPGVAEVMCVDYANGIPSAQVEKQNIVYVAAREAFVNQYVSAVQAAGLRVKIVDVDEYAIMRAVYFAVPPTQNRLGLIIKDNVEVRFLIFHKEEIILSQRLPSDKCFAWVSSMQQIIHSYQTKYPDCLIEKIMFSGALDEMQLLEKNLPIANHLNLEIFNPTHALALSSSLSRHALDALVPRLLLCCGLAIREMPQW